MATTFDNSSLLLFRVGPVLCCAPSLPVATIIPPPALTHPPGIDESRPGIFRHAGHIASSLDLRVKFGVASAQRTHPGRIIVTNIEPGLIGFWVDEIIDVMDFPANGWGSLPAHLPRGVFTRTLILNKKIFLYVEFAQLYKIPSCGYLREYIEQLLQQEQPAAEVKQAIGATSLKPSPAPVDKPATGKQPNDIQIENVATKATSSTTHQQHNNKPEHSLNVTALRQQAKNDQRPSSAKPVVNHDQNNSTITNSDTRVADRKSTTQQGLPSSPNSDKAVEVKTRLKKSTLTDKPVTSSPATSVIASREQTARTFTNIKHTSHPVADRQADRNKTTNKITTSSTRSSFKPDSPTTDSSTLFAKQQNRDTVTNNYPKNSMTSDYDEPSSSVIPGLLFLFMFIGAIAGLTWYLTREADAPIVVTTPGVKPVPQVPETESNSATSPADNLPVHDNSSDSHPVIVSVEEPESSITDPMLVDNDKGKTIDTAPMDIVATEEPLVQENNSTTDPAGETATDDSVTDSDATVAYKADIQKDKEGITIVLDAPDETSVFKPVTNDRPADASPPSPANTATTEATETSDSDNSELITANSNKEATDIVPAKPDDKPPAPRTVNTEIIHIVVKGDTLWHIAIRYVNNPYKYPELARLSNIKNPDLIYPGNRVRIIKRSKPSR